MPGPNLAREKLVVSPRHEQRHDPRSHASARAGDGGPITTPARSRRRSKRAKSRRLRFRTLMNLGVPGPLCSDPQSQGPNSLTLPSVDAAPPG